MASIVIPCAPDIDIHIVSAVVSKEGIPEIVLYHPRVREYMFPKYQGEVTYEMIASDIVCNTSLFYARAYEEYGRNILRVIVPISKFYEIIKNNTHLNESTVLNITTEFPKWVDDLDWYIDSSKQEPAKIVDVNDKGTGDSKTSQKSSEQQRSIPVNPPSREGDTVFWH